MFFESAAIILAIGIVAFGFMRQHKKFYTLAILPAVVIPFANIVLLVAADIAGVSPHLWNTLFILGYLAALFVCVCMMILVQKKLKGQRVRMAYLLSMSAFLLVLLFVFITANCI